MLDFNDLRRVITGPHADRTLSVYLNVDPTALENQPSMQGWRVWLRNALRELSAAHGEERAFAGVQERCEQFAATLRPKSKAIAAFFTLVGEQVFALPVAIEAPEVAFGRPLVAPLLWLLDEYEPHVVALVDAEKARFLIGRMGRTSVSGASRLDVDEYDFPRKTMSASGRGEGDYVHGGNNRDAFAATVEDHRRRFYAEVAAECGRLLEGAGARRILLGGSEIAAHAVRAEMVPAVARAVVGFAPVPRHLGDQAAMDLLLPVAQAYEREHEQTLVDEVVGLARSGGRGALGTAAVLECLERKQVELLLVPWPLRDGELRARLPELALAAGAKVELVAGAAAERLEEEGGLAARLFYAVGPQDEPAAAG